MLVIGLQALWRSSSLETSVGIHIRISIFVEKNNHQLHDIRVKSLSNATSIKTIIDDYWTRHL